MPRRIIKAFQLRHWQSVSFPLKSVGHRCKYQSDSLQFAVIQGRNQPILLHNNGEKLCLLLYFKASNSQSKLMLEKDPLTFSEVTYRFEETSVVICADPYLLWMGGFFPLLSYGLKVKHCKLCVQHCSLACNKPLSIHPAWTVLSLSVPFIMHIQLIKKPHVALHKNAPSQVLSRRCLAATATCWNTKRSGFFFRKLLAYCAKSLFASAWHQTAGVILLRQAQPRPCLPLWQQIKMAHMLESWISAPMRQMKNAGLVWARGEVNK